MDPVQVQFVVSHDEKIYTNGKNLKKDEEELSKILLEQFVVVKYMDFVTPDLIEDDEEKSTKKVKYVLFNLSNPDKPIEILKTL